MMKKIYIAVWLLLVTAAFATVLTGSVNSSAGVVFGIAGLGLIFAPAVWSVLSGTALMKTE